MGVGPDGVPLVSSAFDPDGDRRNREKRLEDRAPVTGKEGFVPPPVVTVVEGCTAFGLTTGVSLILRLTKTGWAESG